MEIDEALGVAPNSSENMGSGGGAQLVERMPDKYSPIRQERFPLGGFKSVRRLAELQYDPINELVKTYHSLAALERFHDETRTGAKKHLDANGNVRRYSAQAHASVTEQKIRVAESLLRYGYGRVPEMLQVEHTEAPKLVINLSPTESVEVSGG